MTIYGLLGFEILDFVPGIHRKRTLALSWLYPHRVAVNPTQDVSLKIENHEKVNDDYSQRSLAFIAKPCARLRKRLR